ncbi:uncharacterized protein YpuA (DUF1002 family) [Keratinibaculum paraultunense]|uniref:Uncharacterized protein YpuA (DUF1002 family) n=1 Tax=Keratinibaculum paraultunense TaxID=1278232 RepID=A0A4V2UTX0_9FIRM|nr:DUF1002 domain-containing protein [Keratinibaculum paraultunense]QQY79437.1 DUF1002 domain-containing protein [Keratinibaculum paraultunense]TCS88070.1 uncharacterized protein YpuA (DUF1002 family) [Keratinibaculum paraultunense]
MKTRIISIILISILIISSIAFADAETHQIVVSLGKDLTQEQRKQMLDQFGVDESVKIIEVTNEEEREYLGEYIDEKIIGTRAISCVYVEKLPEGEGISVESNNITWVTNDMYRNALVTAGVKDAKIKVSSPFPVSGTAALTGILKAFEDLTGKEITEIEKKVASEEIAKTAKLGNEIGREKAEDLISSIKIYIINNNIKSKRSIKEVTEEIAEELGIELTEEQIDEIVSLMKRISKLDLDIDEIKEQLKDLSGKIDEVLEQNIEIRSFLERILDAIVGFFNRLFG